MDDAQAKLEEAKAYAEQKAQEAVDAIDNSDLVTKEDLAEEADAIRDQLSTRGGANLLRNSIGYANMDFWTIGAGGSVRPVLNEALKTLGFGSGFFFDNSATTSLQQEVNVVAGEEYTLSWYAQKSAGSAFYVEVLQDGVAFVDNSLTGLVSGAFTSRFLTFTPSSNQVTIRFTAGSDVEGTLTGLMLSVGNLPAQWTLATGELYNAYVRADEKGLLVLGLDENGNVDRKTVMSPEEFAGYYDENRDGNFERVFWLNKDETVTKKLRAIDEITMGTIKIVRIESAHNRGWAFVPIVPE